MGAILQFDFLQSTKKSFFNTINNIIDEDYDSRRTEEDMYRGDFGDSSISKRPLIFFEKLSTKNQIEKNKLKFEQELSRKNEKYTIDYAVVGNLGYLAVKLKPEIYKNYKSSNGILVKRKKFKNISEFKKYLSRIEKTQLNTYHFLDIYDAKTNEVVGRINGDEHFYKTKPAKVPKKYDFIESYDVYGYGGFCPY